VNILDAQVAGTAGAEQLFRSIIEAADNASIGVLVLRRGAQESEVDILYLNQTTERLLGCSRDEVRHLGFWAFIPEAELPAIRAVQQAVVRGETVPRSLRTSYVHRDGRHVPVEVSLGTIELSGQPGAVLFLTDVTDQRAAEMALRRSEARFRELVNSAPDSIGILRWPEVLFVNPAGARLLELPSCEAAVGLDIRTRLKPAESVVAEQRLRMRRQGLRVPEPYEYQGVSPSGRSVAVEVSTMAIEFERGPATLVFARDVTERNAILARLREAEKLSAVHTLAAGVAHEINNPLAYVLLNLEFLERELPELGGDPERVAALQRRLADTRHGAERVKHIVRDLQALTRKDEAIRAQVELDQILEQALQLVRRELRHSVTIRTEIGPVPCVLGNPTRLEQLYFNLLLNAAHALNEVDRPERSLRVALRTAGDYALTEIEDSGCGMTEQVLSRVFEPFFTTKPLGIGAGLGLSICKRIVDDMSGQIHVQSRPLGGTLVRVLLPVCPESVCVPSPARAQVLLVDDERAVAESLKQALHDDFAVETAGSAREARALLDTGRNFDVVLCDLTMPEESGAEFFEQITAQHPELRTRFVFMSGGVWSASTSEFLERSGCAHVDKPFSLDELRRLLNALIESTRAREAGCC